MMNAKNKKGCEIFILMPILPDQLHAFEVQ